MSRTESKATSTGIIPVLVVGLVLALGGCGGGGDSSTSSEAASSPEAAAKQAGEKSQASKPRSSSEAAHRQEGAAKAKASKPDPAAKQGATIAAPKGPREPEPTPKQIQEATVASMELQSPVLSPGPESVSALPTTYTCKGKDTWPELRWSGIPAGTKELALLVLNLEPVNEALFFDWAITGLDPKLEGLESGKLPEGAILGRNSFGEIGYSICPAQPETVIFALYALPRSLPAARGFDPTALRKRILDVSGNSGLLAVSAG
jgi:phosphatidylethanolamine-binding protein (PEBP) family uncharacterized protein